MYLFEKLGALDEVSRLAKKGYLSRSSGCTTAESTRGRTSRKPPRNSLCAIRGSGQTAGDMKTASR
jgi:hypothetical protein